MTTSSIDIGSYDFFCWLVKAKGKDFFYKAKGKDKGDNFLIPVNSSEYLRLEKL
jgi:hypothetical protein